MNKFELLINGFITAVLVAVGCSSINLKKAVDPWEVANQTCSKRFDGLELSYCLSSVALAQRACEVGVSELDCSTQPELGPLCKRANKLLKAVGPCSGTMGLSVPVDPISDSNLQDGGI